VYVGYSISGRCSAMRFTQTYTLHTVSDPFCELHAAHLCVVLCNAATSSCLSARMRIACVSVQDAPVYIQRQKQRHTAATLTTRCSRSLSLCTVNISLYYKVVCVSGIIIALTAFVGAKVVCLFSKIQQTAYAVPQPALYTAARSNNCTILPS
jgi:hypothetical protein